MVAKALHPRVVAHRPGRIGAFLTLMKAISQSVAAAPGTFSKPDPSLAQFDADIAALDSAETTAKTRIPGSAAVRNQKKLVVDADLVRLVAYVQSLVNQDPTKAQTLVTAAGMSLRKVTPHAKAPLTAKQHTLSGSVKLSAKAVTKTKANEWQFSTDGGKTWTAAPATTASRTMITDLTPAVVTLFRHRTNTKAGPTNWSDPVSLVVA